MFRKIADNFIGILASLCEIVVGVLLLLDPVRFTSGIIVALGIVLALMGAYAVFGYFTADPHLAAKEQKLTRGLTLLGAGLFCALRSGWFISTFPALTILYGVILLLLGFSKVQRTVDMLRMKKETWYIAAISAAVSVIAAAFILIHPLDSTFVLWAVIALSLLAQAVADLLTIFFTHKPAAKKTQNDAAPASSPASVLNETEHNA